MITIIPNWHPILVHFTIALLSTAVLFYFIGLLLPETHRWKEQWHHMANWCLWTGCLFTVATAIAGWFAYNSVAHDAVSHAAMSLHRNWALPTAALFLLIGLSAIILARKNKKPGFKFLSVSAVAAVLLMITGWLGAEAVYRYGLGVMSLPEVEAGADGHSHSGLEPGTNNMEHESDADEPQHSHGNPVTGGSETDHDKFAEQEDGHDHQH